MNEVRHMEYLGKLIYSFQCLETLLRVVLLQLDPLQHAKADLDFERMELGAEIAVNEFTDYESLRVLCQRFNDHMNSTGAPTLNLGLVDIRDAIAHGRIICTSTVFPMRLVKFSKPYSGMVKLLVNDVMDQDWFELQLLRTRRALDRVQLTVFV